MAQVHLRSLLSLAGAEVCGVASPERLPAVSELCESQALPVGPSLDWLIGACRPDAVVVATPTDTHAHLVAEAAEAGCHVFCEKPLGRTAAEAADSLTACQEAGVKLSVGHVVRYFPAYARIAEMVMSGQIGPPGLAKCQRVWRQARTRGTGMPAVLAACSWTWACMISTGSAGASDRSSACRRLRAGPTSGRRQWWSWPTPPGLFR